MSTRRSLPLVVAPTVDGSLFNTIRQGLAPVACFTIAAPGFDFDSSLLLPEMRAEFVKLGRLLEKFPAHPVSLFGHADPTGTDTYNKELAGRRALSVYALLTHQPSLWERLWKSGNAANGDHWTQRHLLIMLGEFFSPATGDPYFTGKPTANRTNETDHAFRAFQQDHDLVVDGDPGPNTRAQLFELYMDLLTQSADTSNGGDSAPSKVDLTPDQFLGQGANADGKGDFQSCGEFNPAIVLSKDDDSSLAPEDRDHENSANRRVTIYLFEKGTQIDLGKWPCPTIKEPPAGCRKRFWSDGEKRRSPADERRTFDQTQDTFACRFYHLIAGGSPCERPTSLTFVVEIFFDLPATEKPVPQSFTMVSTDGVYKQTLSAIAAVRADEKTVVLEFTGVRRGKVYSLSYDVDDATIVPIFGSVPLADIDDFGDETAVPDALVFADEAEPEDPVNEGADDPLLAHDPIDVTFDPSVNDSGSDPTDDPDAESTGPDADSNSDGNGLA